MTVNGNQVLTNPMKPTYFPKKNIHKANLIMFQEVEPVYLIEVRAIPTCEWQLSQKRLCIRFEYSLDALATASSQASRPPSTLFSSSTKYPKTIHKDYRKRLIYSTRDSLLVGQPNPMSSLLTTYGPIKRELWYSGFRLKALWCFTCKISYESVRIRNSHMTYKREKPWYQRNRRPDDTKRISVEIVVNFCSIHLFVHQ